jgi:hypothetical protein
VFRLCSALLSSYFKFYAVQPLLVFDTVTSLRLSWSSSLVTVSPVLSPSFVLFFFLFACQGILQWVCKPLQLILHLISHLSLKRLSLNSSSTVTFIRLQISRTHLLPSHSKNRSRSLAMFLLRIYVNAYGRLTTSHTFPLYSARLSMG